MPDPAKPPTAQLKERRVALVIGCAAYEHARPLRASTGDAALIASLLENLGFEVISGFNCDYNDFRDRFTRFKTAMPGTDLALFYFSGHGVQDAVRKNYLLPTDAQIVLPEDLDRVGIPLDGVMTAIRVEQGVAGVILLDACRDDPFAGQPQGERTKSVLAQRTGLTAPSNDSMHNLLIAFATDAGKTARDGDYTRASPFTEALLRHLGTPGKALTSCLIAVQNEVRDATQFKQVPWSQNSLLREIILKPADAPPPDTRPDAPPDSPAFRQTPPVTPVVVQPLDPPPKRWTRFALPGFLLFLIVGLGAFFLFPPDFLETDPDPCISVTGAAALACRVPKLDSADETTPLETAKDLEHALLDISLSNSEKAVIVAALLDLAEFETFSQLSPDGRFHLLLLLAAIPTALWQDPALIIELDEAHRSIEALIDGRLLGNRTTAFFDEWSVNVGYRPRNQVFVVPHFADFVRDSDWWRLLGALSDGWGWTFEDSERTRKAIGVAQVRYGPDSMLSLALLMAAQLNGQIPPASGDAATNDRLAKAIADADLRRVAVAQVVNMNMPDNQLELWIGK